MRKDEFPSEMPKGLWITLLAATTLPMWLTLGTTLLAPDGTVYALLAKEMVWRDDYLRLYLIGQDWLDKPHFPFWMTALSYQLFGINEWGYRIPGFLFTLLGGVYTYFLARRFYNKQVAQWSSLFYLSALHTLLGLIDLRAEAYLTALIVASVYHFSLARESGKSGWLPHLAAGAFWAALAAMTKGPLGLIVIGSAIGGEILVKKQWRELIHPKWLLAIVLTFLFLAPELYALYIQFDAEPTKVVYGNWEANSGIRFFLWDSQWGRFTNTGPITGTSDPFFFLHTLLWVFLPWSILLYAGVFKRLRDNIPRLQRQQEFYTLSAVVITFGLFSVSRFQLSHYLSILFPFFAILTADYMAGLRSKSGMRFFRITQYLIMGLGIAALAGIHWLFRPEEVPVAFWMILALIPVALFLCLYLFKPSVKDRIITESVWVYLAAYVYLSLVFYPNLLSYQGDDKVARYLNEKQPGIRASTYDFPNSCFEFYYDQRSLRDSLPSLPETLEEEGRVLLVAVEEGKKELEANDIPFEIVETFPHFHITKLTLPFLNHQTRPESLEKRYLLKVDSMAP